MITAVRLRLLPAPEAALALVAFYAHARARAARRSLRVLGGGLRAGGARLPRRRGAGARGGRLPGRGAGRRRASRCCSRSTARASRRARRRSELRELLGGGGAGDRASRRTARRCGAGATAFNGALSGVRGAKVSEDVVVPVERLRRRSSGFERSARATGCARARWGHGGDGNVHATVLVDPATRRSWTRREAAAEELFALVGSWAARSRASTASGWLKRGQLARAVGAAAVAAARADQAGVRPEGAAEPGQEAGASAGAGELTGWRAR